MKKRLAKIIFAILLLLPVCAQATDITFTSDGTIQAGDEWMNAYIYDTPPEHTTVTMTGGSVLDHMGVRNASTLNMSGGNVGGMGASEFATVNISGGSIGALSIYNNATATISQNADIYVATALWSGIINMNGGIITTLNAMENSTLNLRGGSITDDLNANSFLATINVFGYNLAKTNIGGTYGVGQITGFWQDDLPFTINLSGSDTYSRVNLIPEPTTFLLFGIGTFLLRKSY
jgi:hypothetical protein